MPGSGRRQTLTVAAILCVLALAVSPASAQLSPAGDGNATAYKSASTNDINDADFLSASGNDFFAFGAALTSSVPSGDPYAGLSSTVVGVAGLSGGGIKGTDYVGSEAIIRAGINTGSDTTASMAWRTRTNLEVSGYPFGPPIVTGTNGQYVMAGAGSNGRGAALAWDATCIASDIVEIGAVAGSYVLQMSYDDTQIIYDSGVTEEKSQQGGKIYLSWFETEGAQTETGADAIGVLADYDEWVNAVAGNSHTGSKAVANFKGSFDMFLTDHTDFDLADYMGSWGSDIDADLAWAVLDHNSQFGVTPEPATLSLLVVGGLLALRRRR